MRGTDRRILWIVLDGMADRPAPELGGRTPLEAADTPVLDALADAGASGTMDVGPPGTPLSSDRAHAYLFGYDPDALPGRGILEARGLGVAVPDGGVACSASFAGARNVQAPDADTDGGGATGGTDDPGGWRVTDRHLRDTEADCARWGERVATYDAETASVGFEYTWKNRGIVTLAPTAGPLSPAVTDVDPFETGLPVLRPAPTDAASDRAAADRTARALAAYTRWTADRLADAPFDVVLCKWAGARTDPEPFAVRHGLAGCSLTPKPVLAGLAATLDLDRRESTGGYDCRAGAVLDALGEYDFVHAHYPEPDEAAHAGGPAAKRDEIAAVDASLAPVADRARGADDLVTVVTADHTTPSTEDVVHSGAPVPVTVVGAPVRTDGVERAGERPAASGGLGRIAGRDLLKLSRAVADRVLLDGLRRSPAVRDYPNQPLTPLQREEEAER